MRTGLNRADYVMVLHLQHAWNRAVQERLDPHLTVQREEKGFSLVRRFDPSGGRYHAWMSAWRRRLWDERGFLVMLSGEELAQARRALEHFSLVRDRLPPELRDIGQYQNPKDLLSTLPTRVAESMRRKEAEGLKAEAHRQSVTLFHEGDWRVVLLKGPVAARFWGLGTKWCTTSDGTYWDYARRAPLLVFLTPTGRYQLHVGSQFKNAANQDFDQSVFRRAPQGFLAILSSPRDLPGPVEDRGNPFNHEAKGAA